MVGIEAATIRKVADSVGGITGMITHYFQSKKGLINESITSLTERSIAKVDESVGDKYTPERLTAVVNLFLLHPGGDVAPITFWIWVWAEATRDAELRRVIQENFMRTREIMARCAESGIKNGQFRADVDPYVVADALTSLIMGLRLRMALLPDILTPERAVEIAQLLIDNFVVEKPLHSKRRSKGTPGQARARRAWAGITVVMLKSLAICWDWTPHPAS